MCAHENREAAMVTVAENVWCDPCLAPIVKALNAGGLPTAASCCGHGRRPGKIALTDGRELFIMPDFDTARSADDLLAGCVQRAASDGGRWMERRLLNTLYANSETEEGR